MKLCAEVKSCNLMLKDLGLPQPMDEATRTKTCCKKGLDDLGQVSKYRLYLLKQIFSLPDGSSFRSQDLSVVSVRKCSTLARVHFWIKNHIVSSSMFFYYVRVLWHFFG